MASEPVEIQVAGLARDMDWVKKSIDNNSQQALERHSELVEMINKYMEEVSVRVEGHDRRVKSLEKWRNGIVAVGGFLLSSVYFLGDVIREKLFK